MEKTRKNIVLIGFMGSGKTRTGKELATELKLKYYDVDREIEKRENMKVGEIFEIKGEPYFREAEAEVIDELSKKREIVIGCGGGAVLKEVNIEKLKKNGMIVFLEASPEIIYQRLKEKEDRPLLKVADRLSKITELMREREPLYLKAADLVLKIEGKTRRQIVEEIIRARV